MAKKYEQKGITTSIRFTSRCSINIDGKFDTFEACEERMIPEDADVEQERKLLWDTINDEVDKQAEEAYDVYGLKKESVKRN